MPKTKQTNIYVFFLKDTFTLNFQSNSNIKHVHMLNGTFFLHILYLIESSIDVTKLYFDTTPLEEG